MTRRISLLGLTLLLCCAGCNVRRDPASFADVRGTPTEAVVQLRAGDIPRIGVVAVHLWFNSFDPDDGRWRRWEVWLTPGRADDPDSWGHVRRDLHEPGWWWRPQFIHGEWRGEQARRLQAVLARPEDYPGCHQYHYWPGPNSNTYPAWVFRQAGVRVDLPARAVGKDHFSLLGGAGITPSRTGVQVETPLIGFAVGLLDGIEIHVLGSSLGLDTWPPAIQTPLGRIGFPE